MPHLHRRADMWVCVAAPPRPPIPGLCADMYRIQDFHSKRAPPLESAQPQFPGLVSFRFGEDGGGGGGGGVGCR
jgi:hypothetical protein